MVDTQNTDMKQIEQELQEQFFRIVKNRSDYKVAVDEANLKVSTFFDDSKMSIITEVPCVQGVPPEQFKYFVDNWLDCVSHMNPLIKEVKELEPVQGIKVGRTLAEAPWPLANRVTYVARYPIKDYKDDEHLIMLSQRGAESRIQMTEQEKKDLALA